MAGTRSHKARLPPELLLAIFEQCGTPELRQVRNTCTLFNDIATPIYFRNIKVSIKEDGTDLVRKFKEEDCKKHELAIPPGDSYVLAITSMGFFKNCLKRSYFQYTEEVAFLNYPIAPVLFEYLDDDIEFTEPFFSTAPVKYLETFFRSLIRLQTLNWGLDVNIKAAYIDSIDFGILPSNVVNMTYEFRGLQPSPIFGDFLNITNLTLMWYRSELVQRFNNLPRLSALRFLGGYGPNFDLFQFFEKQKTSFTLQELVIKNREGVTLPNEVAHDLVGRFLTSLTIFKIHSYTEDSAEHFGIWDAFGSHGIKLKKLSTDFYSTSMLDYISSYTNTIKSLSLKAKVQLQRLQTPAGMSVHIAENLRSQTRRFWSEAVMPHSESLEKLSITCSYTGCREWSIHDARISSPEPWTISFVEAITALKTCRNLRKLTIGSVGHEGLNSAIWIAMQMPHLKQLKFRQNGEEDLVDPIYSPIWRSWNDIHKNAVKLIDRWTEEHEPSVEFRVEKPLVFIHYPGGVYVPVLEERGVDWILKRKCSTTGSYERFYS